jgi:type II secretory pathway component GspD/PulD (secretin)
MANLKIEDKGGTFIVTSKEPVKVDVPAAPAGSTDYRIVTLDKDVDIDSINSAIKDVFETVKVRSLGNKTIQITGPANQVDRAKDYIVKDLMKYLTTNKNGVATEVITLKSANPEDAVTVLTASFGDLLIKKLSSGKIMLSGDAKRVEEAKIFLNKEVDVSQQTVNTTNPNPNPNPNTNPNTNPTEIPYAVVGLKTISAEKALAVLKSNFQDVIATELDAKRLMITGEKSRIDKAQKMLNDIDLAAPEVATEVEKTYQLKSLVPAQTKSYLDEMYGKRGLSVMFAPVADSSPAGVIQTGNKESGWQSSTMILRGPSVIVEEAIAHLIKIDIGEVVSKNFIEKRYSFKFVVPSQAISYLLERYESKGLVVLAAPAVMGTLGKPDNSGKFISIIKRDVEGSVKVPEGVNDIIMAGPDKLVESAYATLVSIDVSGDVLEKVIDLRYLMASEAKKKLEERFTGQRLRVTLAPARLFSSEAGGAAASGGGGASGSGGDATSSGKAAEVTKIVLYGTTAIVEQAATLIKDLDLPQEQVRISMEIISMDSGEIKNLGLAWPASITASTTEMASGDPIGLGRLIRNPIAFNNTLNMLMSKNKAKIISRPSMQIENGKEGKIHVGRTIFYETLASVTQSGPAYATASINAGVDMKVRPRVSSDGNITLEIDSNVTDEPKFITGPSGSQLPDLAQNSSITTVTVKDGETQIIAGLIKNSDIETESGIPFLNNLPLVGWLFKSKSKSPTKQELLILVTPRIVRQGDKVETPKFDSETSKVITSPTVAPAVSAPVAPVAPVVAPPQLDLPVEAPRVTSAVDNGV